MARVERFEDLDVWQKARDLIRLIYQATSDEKFMRDYGLREQLRRASISILSNVAEGFERGGNKEFCQFLSLAKGSCGEVRAQLYIAYDQAYISKAEFEQLRQSTLEISRMLSGLMKYLKQSSLVGNKYK